MSADDPAETAGGCERSGLRQDDAENSRAPRTQRTHRGDLAPALHCGAVHRDEHVEQHDGADDRQDHLQHILRHSHHVEDGEEHAARENGLGLPSDVELAVETRQVGHALRPDQHRRKGFDRHLPCDFIHAPIGRQREEDGAIVGTVVRPENTRHCEGILGHFLTLVKAITDLQPRRPGRLGADGRCRRAGRGPPARAGLLDGSRPAAGARKR